jgi:ADP-ribose pyrophosphatase
MSNITTLLHHTNFVDLNETTYVDKKGVEKHWAWAQRPNDQQAVMIVATMEGKLVVTREFRVPIDDYEWGCPAGLIDPEESVLQAASREFEEETGLKIVRFLRDESQLVYNSAGLTDEGIHIVFANAEGKTSDLKLVDSEDITVYLMDQKEVRELLNDQTRKKGAKSYLIFLYFSKYGTI